VSDRPTDHLLALVKRLLPIAPVKIIVFELAQINAFEASHVDVERLRIGARYVERCDATIRTEEMPRGLRVECVRRDRALVIALTLSFPAGFRDVID
jgi:hypothetical protein